MFIRNQNYLDPKIKLESEEHAEGYANEVVASNVDVGNRCLPPTANGHTFHQSSSEQKFSTSGKNNKHITEGEGSLII